MWCKKNFLSWVTFEKKKYVCIPRSFLVINVCKQGKTLCSPCSLGLLVCDNVSVGLCLPTFRCNIAPSPWRLNPESWFVRNVDKHPATLRHGPENLEPRHRCISVTSGRVCLYNRDMCLLRGRKWTFHTFQMNFVLQRANKKLRKLERWGGLTYS